MISIGEGCLFRDKVHLVKMGTAADNPTFWYVFRMVIDWTVPKSSTEMRDIILSYCNESMVFEGANKNFSMLEVDFSHHNSVNLAKENTKKQNRHHPASPMKLSSQYFEQTEYAFVVHALKSKSFTSSSLGGSESTSVALLARTVGQLKADCLQLLKCRKPLPRPFHRINISPSVSAQVQSIAVNRIIDQAQRGLLLIEANNEHPSFLKYTRLLHEVQ